MHTPNLASLVEDTKRQMMSITGMEYDTISQFDQSGDGWTLVIDMLEHRSIPRTQDLLSSYEVALDGSGRLKSWRRTNRYTRGQAA
jgi:hypothetical protein